MSGLRKSNQQRCLMNLYEKKGIKYDPREVMELSTGELRNKINQIRGYNKERTKYGR